MALAYCIGIVTGYLLNRRWTFSSHGTPSRGFPKYVTTYALVFSGNLLLLNLFVRSGLMNPIYGQLVALSMVTGMSYVFQRNWVFKSDSETCTPTTQEDHSNNI